MLLAHDDQSLHDSHPYWYARVIGFFHTYIVHSGFCSSSLHPHNMEFLWIRWLGPGPGRGVGWKALRLDRIGFIGKEADSPNCDFLDPSKVLRGAHLIPGFVYGHTTKFLAPSLIRNPQEPDDWDSFYVNR
jgi:hypothetical protein